MGKEIISIDRIAQSIYFRRGQKVLLDFDLAALYRVSTSALKCQFGISKQGEAIQQLMGPPTKTPRKIGFHVRETATRYQTRQS